MTLPIEQALPIDEALPRLAQTLAASARAVLVAPPGAGKTTRVPLALLDSGKFAPWRGDGKIVVLEPRRLAARAAAERMSSLVGDRLGETIGLKVRMQSLSGPKTRIEVVTEGVFARMILDDPSLDGVAAVLFDEFHERSLDADLGLALALDAQAALRPDLRLLVMSATLDGARVSKLMRNAPIVESQGRAFPVETVYLGRDPREKIEEAGFRAIRRALGRTAGLDSGLPARTGRNPAARRKTRRKPANDPSVDVCPLYGAMERAAQDRAIRPAPEGRRKIVLATSIAETSITIDGVRVVIDCGLVRAPRFEPDLGLTRLETLRVSRAAADQRRGRAGRTQPGVCYRLWEEAATGALPAYAQPEILAADLSGLLLDLAAWGARDPNEAFLARSAARSRLRRGARLAARAWRARRGRRDHGARKSHAPPAAAAAPRPHGASGGIFRRRRKSLRARHRSSPRRGLGGDSPDLGERLERFLRENSSRAKDARRLAHGWKHSLRDAARELDEKRGERTLSPGALVALAYPRPRRARRAENPASS